MSLNLFKMPERVSHCCYPSNNVYSSGYWHQPCGMTLHLKWTVIINCIPVAARLMRTLLYKWTSWLIDSLVIWVAVGHRTCTTVKATHFADMMLMVLVSQSATTTYRRRLHLQSMKMRVRQVELQWAGICRWPLLLLVEQAHPSLQHLQHLLHWQATLVFCLHRLMNLRKKVAHDDG